RRRRGLGSRCGAGAAAAARTLSRELGVVLEEDHADAHVAAVRLDERLVVGTCDRPAVAERRPAVEGRAVEAARIAAADRLEGARGEDREAERAAPAHRGELTASTCTDVTGWKTSAPRTGVRSGTLAAIRTAGRS